MIYAFALLLLAGACLLITRTTVPAGGPAPRTVIFDSTGGAHVPPGDIPKIIWSYWHTGQQPLVVQRCVQNWAALNPEFRINVASKDTLFNFVEKGELPALFYEQTPARQSDWLRLYFLSRYGGVWLDASIILTQPLDWLLQTQAASRAHYAGFYLERYTVRPDWPVIDSWCMAAPAGSRFVQDWLAEFSGKAMSDSTAYIESLGDASSRERILQKIASPGYMAIHVCAQVVMHRKRGYRLHLIRAEDSAYFLQSRAGRWKRAGLFAFLLFFRSTRHAPPLIKLRGGERKKLEPYLRHGIFTRRSIAGTLLGESVTKDQNLLK